MRAMLRQPPKNNRGGDSLCCWPKSSQPVRSYLFYEIIYEDFVHSRWCKISSIKSSVSVRHILRSRTAPLLSIPCRGVMSWESSCFAGCARCAGCFQWLYWGITCMRSCQNVKFVQIEWNKYGRIDKVIERDLSHHGILVVVMSRPHWKPLKHIV